MTSIEKNYQDYLESEWAKCDLDLGHDHKLRFTKCGGPGVPYYAKCGAIVMHRRADGTLCEGSIMFDLQGLREVFTHRAFWTVDKWDPLTLSPSLLCKALLAGGSECGDHGYIREGRWAPV
ncbi:MAG TPA: hypothetical protein VJX91_07675 [Candidatus Eisenbacteria bacterium]|nr:hypothetical protein [Candidatus Eisenbacteria bacterium]